MDDKLTFGFPPRWAYPTLGMLWATGTPLPQRITVRISGRASIRVAIDEDIDLSDEEMTQSEIITAALIKAGDYDIEDFVQDFVVVESGRANVVGRVMLEDRISENVMAWDDETDEEILEWYVANSGLDMDAEDFDLSLKRI